MKYGFCYVFGVIIGFVIGILHTKETKLLNEPLNYGLILTVQDNPKLNCVLRLDGCFDKQKDVDELYVEVLDKQLAKKLCFAIPKLVNQIISGKGNDDFVYLARRAREIKIDKFHEYRYHELITELDKMVKKHEND